MDTQENNKMKAGNIILSGLILLAIAGCNRGSIKTISYPTDSNGYDTMQYNLLFSDALKQKMLGNTGDALRFFEQSIRLNPLSDASYYQISQIAAAKGDFVRAKEYGHHAYTLDNENTWYISHIAALYYNENNLDSVTWYYEKLIELDPQREEIFYGLGSIYLETGRYDKAEKIFVDFENKYKGNPQILISLVNVYRAKKENDKAEEILKQLVSESPDNNNYKGLMAEFYKSIGEQDKAIDLYRELFEKDPGSGLLQLSYVDFILKEGNFTELTEFLNTVLLNDNVELDDKLNLFARIISDSSIIASKGNELIISALVLHSDNKSNPSVILLLAELYEKLGKRDKAEEVLEDYIATDPDNYFIWERLLFIYNSTQNIDKLFTYSKRASSLFNRIPVPKLLYAFAATDKGEYEVAIKELNKVRILVNRQPEFMVQILSLEADIYYRQGEYKQAFAKFEEALTFNENDPLILNNYAYFMAEQDHNLKRSLELIERCLQIDSNPTYQDTYAWVLYKMGKFRKAEDLMSNMEALGLLNDPDLLEHYGFILKARKDCFKAIVMWNKALSLDASRDYLKKQILECSK